MVDRLRRLRLKHIANQSPERMSQYDLDQLVALSVRHRVIDGPFAGMRYLNRATGSVLSAKLLGTYEAELHAWIEAIVETPYQTLIDLGCAEGYYAVGLARRMPHVVVHASDINPQARQWTMKLARLNAVDSQIHMHGAATASSIDEWAHGNTMIVCDVEGTERELLRPDRSPAMAQCDLLVEIHDEPNSSETLDLIRARFDRSHQIEQLAHRPRDFREFRLPSCLHDDRLKTRAIAEGRLRGIRWLRMLAHVQSSRAGS